MADQFVQVQPNSTGLKVDTSELTVGSNTVERQRIVLSDPALATGLCPVSATLGASVNVTNTLLANNLTQVGGSGVSLGQKTMANSVPVVLPSDEILSVKQVAPTLNAGQISVGATATLILAANANRTRLLISNLGTTTVFVGNSGVTATTGHVLQGVAGYPMALRFTGAVYGITASGTQSVSYAEETN